MYGILWHFGVYFQYKNKSTDSFYSKSWWLIPSDSFVNKNERNIPIWLARCHVKKIWNCHHKSCSIIHIPLIVIHQVCSLEFSCVQIFAISISGSALGILCWMYVLGIQQSYSIKKSPKITQVTWNLTNYDAIILVAKERWSLERILEIINEKCHECSDIEGGSLLVTLRVSFYSVI